MIPNFPYFPAFVLKLNEVWIRTANLWQSQSRPRAFARHFDIWPAELPLGYLT